MGVERPLGEAGRAGGVDHQGRIVGPAIDGREAGRGRADQVGIGVHSLGGTVEADEMS